VAVVVNHKLLVYLLLYEEQEDTEVAEANLVLKFVV
jgi:hypothetical protein